MVIGGSVTQSVRGEYISRTNVYLVMLFFANALATHYSSPGKRHSYKDALRFNPLITSAAKPTGQVSGPIGVGRL